MGAFFAGTEDLTKLKIVTSDAGGKLVSADGNSEGFMFSTDIVN